MIGEGARVFDPESLPDVQKHELERRSRESKRYTDSERTIRAIKEKIASGEITDEQIEAKNQEINESVAQADNLMDVVRYVNQHVGAVASKRSEGEYSVYDKTVVEHSIFDELSETNIGDKLARRGMQGTLLEMEKTRRKEMVSAVGDEPTANVTRTAGLREAVSDKIQQRVGAYADFIEENGRLRSAPSECQDWVDLVWMIERKVNNPDQEFRMRVSQPDGTEKITIFSGQDIIDYVKYVPLGEMPVDFLPSSAEIAGKQTDNVKFLAEVRQKMEELIG